MGSLKPLLHVCAWVVVLWTAPHAQAQLEVRAADGLVTVRAAGAPLHVVIGEIARQVGMEVIGADKLTGATSADITAQPVERALATILSGVNYMIQDTPHATTSTRGRILRIHSMSGTTSRTFAFNGPVRVPALDALVAEEEADVRDDQEIQVAELVDDPDLDEDVQREKLDASRLATQGAFGPEADLESLRAFARSPNEHIRLEAVKALGSRSMAVALPTLVRALGDEAWDVRTEAVRILGAGTDRPSWEAVGRQLGLSTDWDVRISALRVLALRGEPDSLVFVTPLLKDEDSRLRAVAAQMAGELEARARAQRENAR